MGARIGGRTVYVTDDENVVHQLNPGDDVPSNLAKYFVGEKGQPHRALAHGSDKSKAAESDAAGNSGSGEKQGDDGYEALGYPALKSLAKDRELPQDGKIADLIARLREDDKSKAAESDAAGNSGSGDDENQE